MREGKTLEATVLEWLHTIKTSNKQKWIKSTTLLEIFTKYNNGDDNIKPTISSFGRVLQSLSRKDLDEIQLFTNTIKTNRIRCNRVLILDNTTEKFDINNAKYVYDTTPEPQPNLMLNTYQNNITCYSNYDDTSKAKATNTLHTCHRYCQRSSVHSINESSVYNNNGKVCACKHIHDNTHTFQTGTSISQQQQQTNENSLSSPDHILPLSPLLSPPPIDHHSNTIPRIITPPRPSPSPEPTTEPTTEPKSTTTSSREEIKNEEIDKMMRKYIERLKISMPIVDTDTTDTNRSFDDIILTTKEKESYNFSLLKMLRVPLKPKLLQVILLEIYKLSKQHPECNLLSMQTSDRSSQNVIVLPQSYSNRELNRQTKSVIRALPRLLINPRSLDINPSTSDNNRKAVWKVAEKEYVSKVFKELATKYNNEYESVALEQCNIMTRRKMDKYYTGALFKNMYLTGNQTRMLQSWVNTHLGWSLFASERAVSKLWEDYIRPNFYTWTDDGNNKIEFWDKPIDKLILHRLTRYFDQARDHTTYPNKIDFLVSGDHGCDTFSLVLKIILLDRRGVCLKQIEVAASDIATKKDSYEILLYTIATRVNMMIQNIKSQGNMQLYLYANVDNNNNTNHKVSFSQNDTTPPLTIPTTTTIPFQFLIVGDLKWLNQMLGKVNMEGHWCVWCNLSKNDWKDENHEIGTHWTIERLNTHRELQHNTANLRKGVVKPLLCDTVEITNYIVPCLHLLLGLGNEPLDHLFAVVDAWIEPLTSPDITTKYNQYATAKLAYGIDNMVTQDYKSLYFKALKKRLKANLPIFNNIWSILKEYAIDPALYHGGKLIGPHLRRLMQNSQIIIDRIYDLVIEQPNRRGDATDDIRLCNLFDRYIRLFILFDDFFSLCYAPCGTLTDSDLSHATRLVRCIMKEWRELEFSMGKPKIHCVEDHVLPCLYRFRGLREYLEDFVEKYHQKKKRNQERTSSMRSNKKSQTHLSQREELENDENVKEAEADYERRRPKKRRLVDMPRQQDVNQSIKCEKRSRVFRNAWLKIDNPTTPIRHWL